MCVRTVETPRYVGFRSCFPCEEQRGQHVVSGSREPRASDPSQSEASRLHFIGVWRERYEETWICFCSRSFFVFVFSPLRQSKQRAWGWTQRPLFCSMRLGNSDFHLRVWKGCRSPSPSPLGRAPLFAGGYVGICCVRPERTLCPARPIYIYMKQS